MQVKDIRNSWHDAKYVTQTQGQHITLRNDGISINLAGVWYSHDAGIRRKPRTEKRVYQRMMPGYGKPWLCPFEEVNHFPHSRPIGEPFEVEFEVPANE